MADFHHLDDAREIWLAAKARFGGNEKSKKMRKTMLKQEFLEFSVSEEEGLHKGYDQRYIDLVKKSIKDIIKDEVKSQLPQILPKEVFEFATPVIQSDVNESLENVVLTKSYSQPKSTYETAASLTEFELKKILLDKIQKSKSYQAAPEHKVFLL
nr:ribonuclease H-like domain-containing protein [Tanacetum cinerariifolium]